ncbi:predicted protein [Nematostella vectensis]|uniref:Autophagy-related protein 101 n=1 Tax=Nematostella vectensis TaxID=45351 RepID=A7SWK6_NEMVE|nr:autophagy-related protein 101 [Nematostella vectensis]EDO31926.1 predicted protein [Nematostella vectensis]|eukprot:XP_001624026.1 predicted protein [Nematostella vectensis]
MNARSQIFELSVEGRQIEEAVLSVFHTILFHRTTGKFSYKREGSYSIGTVGSVDVDCDFIDFTYVRCDSDDLDSSLKRQVLGFKDALRGNKGSRSGQISLEFYQKRKGRWPFGVECVPWEIWTLKVNIITLSNEHERQICREKVGESLTEKVLCVAEAMNRRDYVPKMPNQSDVANVFDVSFRGVQPYLHRLGYLTSDQPSASVSNSMKKLIFDTFSY